MIMNRGRKLDKFVKSLSNKYIVWGEKLYKMPGFKCHPVFKERNEKNKEILFALFDMTQHYVARSYRLLM